MTSRGHVTSGVNKKEMLRVFCFRFMFIFLITITGFAMALTNLYSHYPIGHQRQDDDCEDDVQKEGLTR